MFKTCAKKGCPNVNPQPLDAFCKSKGSSDGRYSYCRTCSGIKQKAWYGKSKKLVAEYNIYKNYGLVPGAKDKLYLEQNCACKLCNKPSKIEDLSIDHCHKFGSYRGLLCDRCNTNLGVIEDKEFVELANVYLEEHN